MQCTIFSHQEPLDYCHSQDAYQVRNCYLSGLNDLDGGKDYVRGKIADYANDLLNLGVKGFRVDASKHMWPGDLEAIQVRHLRKNVQHYPNVSITGQV